MSDTKIEPNRFHGSGGMDVRRGGETDQRRLFAVPAHLIDLDDGVVIKRGRTELRVRGDGAAQTLQIILTMATEDGATVSEITRLFSAPDRPAVADLIRELEERRFLLEGGAGTELDQPEAPAEVFFWHFETTFSRTQQDLLDARVCVVGVNHVSRAVVKSLAEAGFGQVDIVDMPGIRHPRMFGSDGEVRDDEFAPFNTTIHRSWAEAVEHGGELPRCVIGTSDFGYTPALRELNRLTVAQDLPFLPLVIYDLIGMVGPIIIPGTTACLECTIARENSHLDQAAIRRTVQLACSEQSATAALHPSMATVVGAVAALELTKYLTQIPRLHVGSRLDINLLEGSMKARRVLKVPRCPVCSDMNERPSTALTEDVFVPSAGM